VLEQPGVDWLAILDDNPFLACTGLAALAEAVPSLRFVDCGEQLIYAELAAGRPVVAGASRGGSGDWWRDPLDYYETEPEALRRAVADAGVPIRYERVGIDHVAFARRNPTLLPPRRRLWRRDAVRWRYGLDDEGRPLFVHHGRGSSRPSLRAWRRLAKAAR
jgi:hypothetical protein